MLKEGIYKIEFSTYTNIIDKLVNEIRSKISSMASIYTKNYAAIPTNPGIGQQSIILHSFSNYDQTINVIISSLEFSIVFKDENMFMNLLELLEEHLRDFIESNQLTINRFGFRKLISKEEHFNILDNMGTYYPDNAWDKVYNSIISNEFNYDSYLIRSNIYYENKFAPTSYKSIGKFLRIIDIDGFTVNPINSFHDMNTVLTDIKSFIDDTVIRIEK